MKHVLKEMLVTIQDYKHDKRTLLETRIQERLDRSFNTYNKELQQSILFLTRKHEKSIMKRLTKLNDKTN